MVCGKKMAGRDKVGFFLLALGVMMIGRSFTLCFSNDIWYDELFTVGMAEHSYSGRRTSAAVLLYCQVVCGLM